MHTGSKKQRLRLLTGPQWRSLAGDHRERVSFYTDPYLERRQRGQKHPVEDFLFTYYTLKPGQLKKWHPGAGVILLDAQHYLEHKFYRPASAAELVQAGLEQDEASLQAGTSALVDQEAFVAARLSALEFSYDILTQTLSRAGYFGCFGMHEWAMAYRSQENKLRHNQLPLRLGAKGTDRVVESHRIRCSHFDAFRFFMPQASSLNTLQPSRSQQRQLEQAACLHANMDIYKWAYKLAPAISSELVLQAFELAWQIRQLDMRAAPYDLTDWGYRPVSVETSAGKAQYLEMQRDFSHRSQQLRRSLLGQLKELMPAA